MTIIALYSIVLQVGISSDRIAGMAQSVERRIGSAEVTGPIPVASLTRKKAVIIDEWYATRQVDKLNNENFSFLVLYVPGFFMLHFEVSLCDTPLVSGYLSFAEPVC